MRIPVRLLSALALVTAALVLAPRISPAQSLGELAEKEKEKRKAAQKPAKTYNENDLARAKGSGTSVTGTVSSEPETKAEGAAATAPGEAKPEKSSDEQREEAQKAWRARIDKANADVSRLQAEIADLQTRLADFTQNPYSEGRGQAQTRLEQAQGELATAKASVDSLEAEGRRNMFR